MHLPIADVIKPPPRRICFHIAGAQVVLVPGKTRPIEITLDAQHP